MQRTALERIARHRRNGVLRSDLSKTFNMDAKTFHYTATVSFDLLDTFKRLTGYFCSCPKSECGGRSCDVSCVYCQIVMFLHDCKDSVAR